MPPKNKRFQTQPARLRPRPGQDIIVAKKQAAQFPTVGMTLPSYSGSGRRAGQYSAPGRNAATSGKSRLKRFFSWQTLKRASLTVLIVFFLIGSWVGLKFLYNAHKLFGGSIFSIFHTTRLRGEDTGRVNILLAGNSADDPGHNGANLTDSIMLISIDTKHNTAFILSIPRDLWVNIPGGGYQKINDAYVVGQSEHFHEDGYPSGGMGLLESIVSRDLGVPIDYYALINYSALRDSVNAVGGIDVNIKSDDPRGLYDPSIDYATHGPLVRLSNGHHVLSGQQALDLARARGDAYGSYGFGGSDFERTQNQRMMLVAIKQKASSVGVLTNPSRMSKLSDAVGNNVSTDMKFNELLRLIDLTKPIGSGNIQSLSLNDAHGQNLLTSYQSLDGESALIPAQGLDDFSAIQAYLSQQISSDPVQREYANVVVLNASGVSGLASKERTMLKLKHINITAIGNASVPQATTTIINNSDDQKPATKQLLVLQFGNHITSANPYASLYPQADFIVLLGADQASRVPSN